MAEGPIRALTGRRRTRLTSTGCRDPWQPEPGRAPLIAAQAAVQTNGATSLPPATAANQATAAPTRRPAAVMKPTTTALRRAFLIAVVDLAMKSETRASASGPLSP